MGLLELALGLIGLGVNAHDKYKAQKKWIDLKNEGLDIRGADYHYHIDGNRYDDKTGYRIHIGEPNDAWYKDEYGMMQHRKCHVYKFASNGEILEDMTLKCYRKMIKEACERARSKGARFERLSSSDAYYIREHDDNLLQGKYRRDHGIIYYDTVSHSICSQARFCGMKIYVDIKTGQVLGINHTRTYGSDKVKEGNTLYSLPWKDEYEGNYSQWPNTGRHMTYYYARIELPRTEENDRVCLDYLNSFDIETRYNANDFL